MAPVDEIKGSSSTVQLRYRSASRNGPVTVTSQPIGRLRTKFFLAELRLALCGFMHRGHELLFGIELFDGVLPAFLVLSEIAFPFPLFQPSLDLLLFLFQFQLNSFGSLVGRLT